jgi:hypothetical protein
MTIVAYSRGLAAWIHGVWICILGHGFDGSKRVCSLYVIYRRVKYLLASS